MYLSHPGLGSLNVFSSFPLHPPCLLQPLSPPQQLLSLDCFIRVCTLACISGIVCLIDVKWKGSKLIGYLSDCMALPFDHTHDLDLGVSRSESELALSREWDGQLTWNEKAVNYSNHLSVNLAAMSISQLTFLYVGWYLIDMTYFKFHVYIFILSTFFPTFISIICMVC